MSVAISWANKMQLAKCDIMVDFPISSHIYSDSYVQVAGTYHHRCVKHLSMQSMLNLGSLGIACRILDPGRTNLVATKLVALVLAVSWLMAQSHHGLTTMMLN